MQKYVIPGLGAKAGARTKRAKPNGNPAISAASSLGISAVLQRKIHDVERVRPIIFHLIQNQGCTSYWKLADALNYLEVPAPRGGHWHPSSAKNLMSRWA